jgi:antitoxin component of MazEF toxin-antitoxin module
MTDSSFVVPLKKWGNSYVLKVPPQIAKLYDKGVMVKVTIEETKFIS